MYVYLHFTRDEAVAVKQGFFTFIYHYSRVQFKDAIGKDEKLNTAIRLKLFEKIMEKWSADIGRQKQDINIKLTDAEAICFYFLLGKTTLHTEKIYLQELKIQIIETIKQKVVLLNE